MSVIPSGLSRLAQFYLSGPLPCPYLPGQVERKLFTRISGDGDRDMMLNSALTRTGFRRSHDIIYRPACPACQACMPVRVPASRFAPSRGQRRLARRNLDLCVALEDALPTPEQFDLFLAYQAARHGDGDMARMGYQDYRAMILEGQAMTQLLTLRDRHGGTLQAVMLADRLDDGLSAIYSFYSPADRRRSLGTQLILSLIEACVAENLPYVYLGYWIKAARKMAYKGQFQPLQTLGANGWTEEDVQTP
ncbi:MAG: arginyltransferase [Alphaproteobacteria bacterium]